jgi:hypothetical protein
MKLIKVQMEEGYLQMGPPWHNHQLAKLAAIQFLALIFPITTSVHFVQGNRTI